MNNEWLNEAAYKHYIHQYSIMPFRRHTYSNTSIIRLISECYFHPTVFGETIHSTRNQTRNQETLYLRNEQKNDHLKRERCPCRSD